MRLFPFRRRENDLDAEIQAHLRMAEQDRIARGETGNQARAGARREFGNEAVIKEVTRATWGWSALRSLPRDFRYAARMLRKNPGFSAVVVCTLALGIGANTAIFSAMRAALAPAPVPAIDRVVVVWNEIAARDIHKLPVSGPDFWDWKQSGVFSSLAVFEQDGRNLRVGNRSERIDGVSASGDFFTALAIQPQLGRVFGPQDKEPVAVLSDGLWRGKFASDRSVVGSTIVLDGSPYTVIGVLPRDFPRYGDNPVYCPLALTSPTDAQRGERHYFAMGRLRDGISLPAAQKQLDALSARLAAQYPPSNTGTAALLQPLDESLVEDAQTLVLVLFAAVGFVLLIACANIANLVLARGTSRTKEMTVRTALGASRWQLARQLLTETLLLSLLGGVLAILPAAGAMNLMASFRTDQLPNTDRMALDWPVLTFNLLLAVGTGVLCGLAPAWQMRRLQVHDALKASGRGVIGGTRHRLRGLLVVSEVALTLVLLAGAGLMIRTFWRLRSSYPGYDSSGVLTMKIALSPRQYPSAEKQAAFFAGVLRHAAAVPGVRNIGATDDLPTSDNFHGSGIYIVGRPDPRPADIPIVLRNRVTGDYFRAMRIPLQRGRYLDEGDVKNAPLVAIIDEWTARRFWPHEEAVGKLFKLGRNEPVRRVVGVVGTVDPGVAVTLVKGRLGQFYLPEKQDPRPEMVLVARTDGDPLQLVSSMRNLVRQVDPDQPLFDVMTMPAVRAAGSRSQELASLLLGGFAAVAMLLAAIGLYGVMAYTVGQRTREFGIRMSLGAQPGDVLRLVIRRSLMLTAAGLLLGLLGAFGLTRLMQDLLYGVAANDPMTFGAVTAILASVTLCAGYLPARRATRVDPVLALRDE